MTCLLEIPRAPSDQTPSRGAEGSVRGQVLGLLAGMYGEVGAADLRTNERFAFPRLVYVTPTDGAGMPGRVGTFVAAGRHLSEGGLGFFHPDPIPFREVIVSLEETPGTLRSFLMELRWCKFIRQDWYESGGRLLRAVPNPEVAGETTGG